MIRTGWSLKSTAGSADSILFTEKPDSPAGKMEFFLVV